MFDRRVEQIRNEQEALERAEKQQKERERAIREKRKLLQLRKKYTAVQERNNKDPRVLKLNAFINDEEIKKAIKSIASGQPVDFFTPYMPDFDPNRFNESNRPELKAGAKAVNTWYNEDEWGQTSSRTDLVLQMDVTLTLTGRYRVSLEVPNYHKPSKTPYGGSIFSIKETKVVSNPSRAIDFFVSLVTEE